jgi:LVIVD repeat
MVRLLRLLLPAALLGLLVFAWPAGADHAVDQHSPNMVHVGNVPRGGTNTDLAFWGNLAVAGHYAGFRVIDISKPEDPRLIIDYPCNGGQGDVSLYQAKERLLLIQSVDTPQNNGTCASSNVSSDVFPGPLDWEGIRILDVTNPATPFLVRSVETECGSHTHTTIPDDENQRAIVYISSYPLAPGIGDECQIPHSKIGIVTIPDENPAAATVRYQPIHAQPVTLTGHAHAAPPGTIGCHDITAFTDPKVNVAAAACLTEGQLWDISDPANPCTIDETCHTHVDNEAVEIWHSSTFTWDARVVLFGDEHGGGLAHGCDSEAEVMGNIWFYKMPPPRVFQQSATPIPSPRLYGRYMIPRPQPATEACTLHNFSIVPIKDNERYIGVSSSYEGGTTVFDFTPLQTVETPLPNLDPFFAPLVAEEIAFWDAQNTDGAGRDDVWSSYWYNDYIYANGGLGTVRGPQNLGGRGLDIFKLLDERGRHFTARSFQHFNSQTQEDFQALGG